MKKALFTQLIFLVFITKNFAQSSSEEFNPVQKFIESTVQIPFMAKVSDVQGAVNVQVTFEGKGLPFKYEIVKSLKLDCDLEALRVVKLINVKNLYPLFSDKKVIVLEVPFQNKEKIILENGFVINYFDVYGKSTQNSTDKQRFLTKYFVDTVSGLHKSYVEYFEIKNQKLKSIGYTISSVDSTERNIPTFYEDKADTLKILKYSSINTSGLPMTNFENYENGQIYKKQIGEKTFYYFPNGRIKTVLEEMEVDSEKVVKETNWYANGQVLAISTFFKAQPNDAHKYVTVWDTLGNVIVNNGNGIAEFYQKDGVEIGNFKDGYKDKIWIKRKLNGAIDYKESYASGQLLAGTRYIGKDSVEYVVADMRANFKDGMRGFGKHLQTNLKYPIEAMKSGAEGTVLVEFTIQKDGILCDYLIKQSVGKSLDEEALRVVKLTNGKWKSAKHRGMPIVSKLILPIKFQNLGVINR
jgi:TonB family protein